MTRWSDVREVPCDLLDLDGEVDEVVAGDRVGLLGRVGDLLFDARQLAQRIALVAAHLLHLAAHLRHILLELFHLVGQDAAGETPLARG